MFRKHFSHDIKLYNNPNLKTQCLSKERPNAYFASFFSIFKFMSHCSNKRTWIFFFLIYHDTLYRLLQTREMELMWINGTTLLGIAICLGSRIALIILDAWNLPEWWRLTVKSKYALEIRLFSWTLLVEKKNRNNVYR